MRVNIVSRIAEGKDFFIYYLDAVNKLRQVKHVDVNINFIGSITSIEVYENIIMNANRLNISDLISFTKRSISYDLMPNLDNDFYINSSIGSFVGYSSLECLKYGFKTIFFNVDRSIEEKFESRMFCNSVDDLVDLLFELNEFDSKVDSLIVDNLNILRAAKLTAEESDFLLDIIS